MSAIITCRNKFVWKYSAYEDDSFLGLGSVPEVVGLGKVITVAFDQDLAIENGELVWREVDPRHEEVQGEVLIIEANEAAKLRKYLEEANLPKRSFWHRITKKDEVKPNSLLQLLIAIVPHLSSKESNEFIFAW